LGSSKNGVFSAVICGAPKLLFSQSCPASVQVKPPRRSQAIGNETKNGDFFMGFDGDLLESMEFAGDFIGSFYYFFSGDLVGFTGMSFFLKITLTWDLMVI
jgi:hypothetical protein